MQTVHEIHRAASPVHGAHLEMLDHVVLKRVRLLLGRAHG